MDKVNASLSEINEEIMQGNEEILQYNESLFSMSFSPSEATPEANANRIAGNAAKIGEIEEQAKKNLDSHDKVMESATSGHERTVQNAKKILERRKIIEERHGKAAEQTATIAT